MDEGEIKKKIRKGKYAMLKRGDMGAYPIGAINGKLLMILAYVRDCNEMDCPVADKCPNATSNNRRGQCKFEKNALSYLYNTWVDPETGIGDRLSQSQLNRIGTELVPLYAQHLKVQRSIYAMRKIDYTDKKGKVYIYPHLKEQREIIKMIDIIISDMGLEKIWEKKHGSLSGTPGPGGFDGMYLTGQEGAYEQMSDMQDDEPDDETK